MLRWITTLLHAADGCAGHVIDGRVLFPAAGYLELAWRTLARLNGTVTDKLPVVFEDVNIHRATIMPQTGGDGVGGSISITCCLPLSVVV